MVSVLVVDDSAFARLSITRQLDSDPEIEIAGYAADGIEAVEKVKELKPGVVTLDVSMPRMNGLDALEHIMSECPTPVVMLSSLTAKGSDITIRALEIGAVDFFLKSSPSAPIRYHGAENSLNEKIKAAAQVGLSRLRRKNRSGELPPRPGLRAKKLIVRSLSALSKVVVIGSSTGGPGALYEVIPRIPVDIPASILMVQHMPPEFTRSLADRLNEISQISVKEAEPGDPIREGQALLAPGGYHMEVKASHIVGLNRKPPVLGVRPSVDVTMQSVARVYGSASRGVVLTGMGSDGTRGSGFIKAVGGKVAVQDADTSVIYGMPRSVAESGYADKIVPLEKIADEILRMCQD